MARKIGSVGAETAQNIRRAALTLFASRGYAAVSMRQIADAVGLQPGALYNHFATKQDLLREVMAGHLRELIEAWEEESQQFSDPLAALEGFVRFHIRFHIGRADAVFVSYMELRNLESENFRIIEGMRKYYEGCLRKIVAQGEREKEFALEDVPVAVMALIAMLTGVTTWYRSGGRLSPDEIEDFYVKMALRSVGAKTETG